MGEAWTALSTLIAGIVVWGGIGYAIDYFAGTRPVLTVIGVLAGNFGAIYLMYVKYFRLDESAGVPYGRTPTDAP